MQKQKASIRLILEKETIMKTQNKVLISALIAGFAFGATCWMTDQGKTLSQSETAVVAQEQSINQQTPTDPNIELESKQVEVAVIEQVQQKTSESQSVNDLPVTNQSREQQIDYQPQAFIGASNVLQERYVDQEEVIDENWDDENDADQQRRNRQLMTEQELANLEAIAQLEMMLHQGDINYIETDRLRTELDEQFSTYEDQSQQLLDLQCTERVCRVAVQVSDEMSQLDVLQELPEQFDWVEQSFADIEVEPDDSRVLTVYLTKQQTL